MKETIAARRYAKAMLEAFGKMEDLDRFSADFSALAKSFDESRDLTDVMQNPVFSDEEKMGILNDLLAKANAGDAISSSMRIILENRRFGSVVDIAEEFETLTFEALGKVRVEVASAEPLTEEEKSELTNKLSGLTGKKAVMSITQDKSLIGGIVARVGSKVYDGSVVNQLKALRTRI